MYVNFLFNETATTESYTYGHTLSLHDALPIFLLLVALSSAAARLYGKTIANRLVRFGFVPLSTAIVLTWIVIQLPTDEGMYEPAKEAFPDRKSTRLNSSH